VTKETKERHPIHAPGRFMVSHIPATIWEARILAPAWTFTTPLARREERYDSDGPGIGPLIPAGNAGPQVGWFRGAAVGDLDRCRCVALPMESRDLEGDNTGGRPQISNGRPRCHLIRHSWRPITQSRFLMGLLPSGRALAAPSKIAESRSQDAG
jgi:hypothetical protein